MNHRAVTTFLVVAVLAAPADAQILRLTDMNTDQIRALDRARTAVVIAGAPLEEHGPYLPSFTDGFWAERLSREVAEGIAARPGWVSLMFPTIPLGTEGANETVGKYAFPGTYTVRPSTLRAVYMDLADALGEQGFRWIFVLSVHGSLSHNNVLHDVEQYFFDRHKGRFVHLAMLVDADLQRKVAATIQVQRPPIASAGPHGGWGETSGMLFLAPHLVRSDYKTARADPGGTDLEQLAKFGRSDDWLGYWGAPGIATSALGADLMRVNGDYVRQLALKILDGLDPLTLPHRTDVLWSEVVSKSPTFRGMLKAFEEHEQQSVERHQRWLAARGKK
ncbi:MAG: creatininase family protein [Gemmatimonadota bacterium]|nr:creatininase family protein [Gemmatimonadota bacterium]